MNLIKIIIFFLVLFQLGCESKDCEILPPPPLEENSALYLSIDGGSNNSGMWILDANSLEVLDSLPLGQSVPLTIEFAPDYSKWYSIWSTDLPDFQYTKNLYSIQTRPMEILNSIPLTMHGFITSDWMKKYLIAYLGNGLTVFDRETMQIVKDDTTLLGFSRIASSKSRNKLYCALSDKSMFQGILVYDLDCFCVEKIIPVADSTRRKQMQPKALAVSPDDKYAFLSVFNWSGGSGYNSFIVIDIASNEMVTEFSCGAFAQLGVSPDGKHVYITDPAGYLYQFITTGYILRYDVDKRRIETFISSPKDLGLTGVFFVSDQIVVAPDNRTVFIVIIGTAKNKDDEYVHIIKVDALSKNLLGTYSLPRDSSGYLTQQIRAIRLGKYPSNSMKRR